MSDVLSQSQIDALLKSMQPGGGPEDPEKAEVKEKTASESVK